MQGRVAEEVPGLVRDAREAAPDVDRVVGPELLAHEERVVVEGRRAVRRPLVVHRLRVKKELAPVAAARADEGAEAREVDAQAVVVAGGGVRRVAGVPPDRPALAVVAAGVIVAVPVRRRVGGVREGVGPVLLPLARRRAARAARAPDLLQPRHLAMPVRGAALPQVHEAVAVSLPSAAVARPVLPVRRDERRRGRDGRDLPRHQERRGGDPVVGAEATAAAVRGARASLGDAARREEERRERRRRQRDGAEGPPAGRPGCIVSPGGRHDHVPYQ